MDQVGGRWAGEGVTIRAGTIQVDNGSKIRADGQGYTESKGPGAGLTTNDGGSYGGRWREEQRPDLWLVYDADGSRIRRRIGFGWAVLVSWRRGDPVRGERNVDLNGAITANGMFNNTGGWGTGVSGGSGGSIYVTTRVLTGTGNFVANGANGPYYGVGGGGGRIAVYYGEGSGFTGFTSSTASGGALRGRGSDRRRERDGRFF